MDKLPPGLRFYPTEEELISFYLRKKFEGEGPNLDCVIPVVDIYECNPWDLPQFAGPLCHKDPEQWFFFIPRQEREARGGRPNRLTTEGYWKATGSPGFVYSSNNRIVGMKRTMVFYKGRAPTGRKTVWKINEYKAIEGEVLPSNTATPKLRQEFSLCRVYTKTKCLRSFDRRPSGGAGGGMGETRARGAHHVDEATTSQQNLPVISSPDSSSSDEAAMPSQIIDSNNWDIAVDNEHLWEWEQLNDWFQES